MANEYLDIIVEQNKCFKYIHKICRKEDFQKEINNGYKEH